MAQASWPFENADTTELQYSKLMSRLAENGIFTGLTISAATGLNLNIAAGAAVVRGFYYENDANTTVTVSTPHATLQRKDYLVLVLDLAANSILPAVKAGTATSGGGTLPALVQTSTVWEHPIGVITVPGGASNIVSGNIENWTNRTGLRVVPYSDTTERSHIQTDGSPILGINTSTRSVELWNGTSWLTVSQADWTTMLNKPTAFTPTEHTHTASDITDQENISAGYINGHKVYIQPNQPPVGPAGELWFW